MTVIDQSLIEYVIRTIVEWFDPDRVIRFGSHALGDAGPDSDLDLFIEMDTDLQPLQRTVMVDTAFGLRRWPMDVLVYTPEEVERLRGLHGTLLKMIEGEGKVLYERAGIKLP